MYTGPRIITNGLLSYLDAGNTKSYSNGTVWTDLLSTNHVDLNNCTFNSSNFGNVDFDGSSYGIVSSGSLTGSCTVELVFNHQNYGVDRYIVYKNDYNIIHEGSTGDYLYFVRLTNNSGYTFGDSIWSGYTGIYQLVSSGETCYLMFTHDTASGVFKAYKNGLLNRTVDGFYNNSTGLSTGYGGLKESVGDYYFGYPPVVTSGLTLYLDAGNPLSYNGSGTTWYDMNGSVTNGTLVSGVTFDSGTTKSMIFDGINDYVALGSFFTYNYFTISLWVNPGVTQIQYADIFDNNHTGNRNFVLQQNILNTNQYSFICLNAVNNSETPKFYLTANMWTHLTLVWNNDKASFYINGVLSGTGNSANPISYNTTSLLIGNWNGGGRNWNGKIGNFLVYNRVLSQQEITQNFNSQRTRFGV